MALRHWSTTASGNASAAGVNWQEGQAPSTVNNSAREMMAQMRAQYAPGEWHWIAVSNTASVASQTSFKLSSDLTAHFHAARRVRLTGGSAARYASIVSSTFAVDTTVTVAVDSGSLSASHTIAALGPAVTSSPVGGTTSSLYVGGRLGVSGTASFSGVVALAQGATLADTAVVAWGDGSTSIAGRSDTDVVTVSVASGEAIQIIAGNGSYFPLMPTTASAANAFLNSGSTPANLLQRSTSSLRYKRDVAGLDTASAIAILRALRPITYQSAIPTDRQDVRWYGFAAEDVAKVDASLVHWGYADEDMEIFEQRDGQKGARVVTGRRPKAGSQQVPDGVQYERFTVIHTAVLLELLARIEALEAKAQP